MARTTSNDKRPRLDATEGVKNYVNEMKEHLKYKKDSEVIAYLIAVYEEKYKGITLPQDIEFRKRAEELNNQAVFKE